MHALGYLQTDTETAGWIWIVILLILLLIVIIWWFKYRRVEPVGMATTPMQADRAGDDLIKIEGIGPKVAKVLNDAGITTFAGLASANSQDLRRVLDQAGLQMMNPEGWIEQASLAARGDWEGLEGLQRELKGGRRE